MKFFHTADLHLGVENYGKIDPQTGIHSRLWDFAVQFEACVNQAIQDDIDFFLFCGDAYKTPLPTPTQQKLLVTQLLKLHKAKIPVVIIVGNHDHPLSFGKSHALDVFSYLPLDGFHVIAKPESITLNTKSGPVQIVGIPWPTRNYIIANEQHRFKNNQEIANYITERVGSIIQTLTQTLNPEIPSILAAHLTVSNGIFSGSEKCAIFGNDPVFLPSQLALAPYDYVALGHLHRHQNLNPHGIPIVYPGSIERVDFGERKEEKGYCHVTITTKKNKKSCSYEFIKLQTRPMIQLEVHLTSDNNHTQQLIAQLEQHDLAGALVKILYHVPEGSQDHVDLYAIQRACAQAHTIVSITPIHQVTSRPKRAILKEERDIPTLLQHYFEQKELSPETIKRLLAKAQTLAAQNSYPPELPV